MDDIKYCDCGKKLKSSYEDIMCRNCRKELNDSMFALKIGTTPLFCVLTLFGFKYIENIFSFEYLIGAIVWALCFLAFIYEYK